MGSAEATGAGASGAARGEAAGAAAAEDAVGAEAPVALVTGANRGTGRAVAEALHRRGYRVGGLDRTPAGLPWLTEFPVDLADQEQVAAAVGRFLTCFGRLDVCVANAVSRPRSRVEHLDPETWARAVAVNVTSVLTLVRATLPAMRRSRGSYVVLGSHAASRYFECGAAYSMTKAALKPLVETLLLEERPHGVRATLVSPGAVANRDTDTDPYKLSPSAVAEVVVALAADQPPDLVVGEVEIRPARLRPAATTGMDRLQAV